MEDKASAWHWCDGCQVHTTSHQQIWSHPLAGAGQPPGRTCHHCHHHNLHSLEVVSNPLALLEPVVEDGGVRFVKEWEDVLRRSHPEPTPGIVASAAPDDGAREGPSRGEMEEVLEDWGVLPEGPGVLEDDHLTRRYQVF